MTSLWTYKDSWGLAGKDSARSLGWSLSDGDTSLAISGGGSDDAPFSRRAASPAEPGIGLLQPPEELASYSTERGSR